MHFVMAYPQQHCCQYYHGGVHVAVVTIQGIFLIPGLALEPFHAFQPWFCMECHYQEAFQPPGEVSHP